MEIPGVQPWAPEEKAKFTFCIEIDNHKNAIHSF